MKKVFVVFIVVAVILPLCSGCAPFKKDDFIIWGKGPEKVSEFKLYKNGFKKVIVNSPWGTLKMQFIKGKMTKIEVGADPEEEILVVYAGGSRDDMKACEMILPGYQGEKVIRGPDELEPTFKRGDEIIEHAWAFNDIADPEELPEDK